MQSKTYSCQKKGIVRAEDVLKEQNTLGSKPNWMKLQFYSFGFFPKQHFYCFLEKLFWKNDIWEKEMSQITVFMRRESLSLLNG